LRLSSGISLSSGKLTAVSKKDTQKMFFIGGPTLLIFSSSFFLHCFPDTFMSGCILTAIGFLIGEF